MIVRIYIMLVSFWLFLGTQPCVSGGLFTKPEENDKGKIIPSKPKIPESTPTGLSTILQPPSQPASSSNDAVVTLNKRGIVTINTTNLTKDEERDLHALLNKIHLNSSGSNNNNNNNTSSTAQEGDNLSHKETSPHSATSSSIKQETAEAMRRQQEAIEESRRQQEAAEAARREQEDKIKREEEARKAVEAEAKHQQEEAERKQKEEETRKAVEAEAKHQQEEAERKQKEEEARKAAETEAKHQQEEAERKQKEEETRKAVEAEAKHQQEEAERKQEEETRLKTQQETNPNQTEDEQRLKRQEEEKISLQQTEEKKASSYAKEEKSDNNSPVFISNINNFIANSGMQVTMKGENKQLKIQNVFGMIVYPTLSSADPNVTEKLFKNIDIVKNKPTLEKSISILKEYVSHYGEKYQRLNDAARLNLALDTYLRDVNPNLFKIGYIKEKKEFILLLTIPGEEVLYMRVPGL